MRSYTFMVTAVVPDDTEAGDVATDLAEATSALGYHVSSYELIRVDGERV